MRIMVFHVQRAHLQVMLWKAADQPIPPQIELSQFGVACEGRHLFKNSITSVMYQIDFGCFWHDDCL